MGLHRPQAAAVVPPYLEAAPSIPGLDETQPTVAKLAGSREDVERDIKRLTLASEDAEARRRRLVASGAPSADIQECDAQIADAAVSIAHREERLLLIDEDIKAAKTRRLAEKKAELKRRALHIRAEADGKARLWPKIKDRASDLDVLHSKCSRAGDYSTTTEAEADAMLARSAEFAAR